MAAVYGATKAYVLSFSEAIGEELRHSGVTVTALCPGPTQTGFSAAAGASSTRLYGKQKPMSSADVARAGYEGLNNGRRVVVTGLRNKLLVQSIRMSPRPPATAAIRQVRLRVTRSRRPETRFTV